MSIIFLVNITIGNTAEQGGIRKTSFQQDCSTANVDA
jgi:hypothetical protein